MIEGKREAGGIFWRLRKEKGRRRWDGKEEVGGGGST